MNTIHAKTNRRAFFLAGGMALGAGIATAAGATMLAPHSAEPLAQQLARHQDIDAIRRLHAAYVACVEDTGQAGAAPTHRAYRSNSLQLKDAIDLSTDRRQAHAMWHVDVQVGTPLEGSCTLAQMARLQGNYGELHWESGRLEAHYAKVDGQWQMVSAEFHAS